ncbi:MAG: filamentous hemagglutinin N-terminal domain-containing protein [Aulosira sp. DedQUE10]|nr:filamentous hemagglutinin N-terminal domain-containing protein [Aulosira sp. DedQUE10]
MVSASRQQLWQLRLLIVVAISGVITAWMDSARAQIIPDGTLGLESTKLTPNAKVQGLPATLIEGGATRGVNLFQSFLQFNVGDGQRVYFANPAGVENILTRVTGSDPSKIFGTLGVNGTANLFLLNPNGIVFGLNARLDVTGSFLATTANSFVFENGLKFSATNPEAAPLLTVSIRPGLQFGANQSASISNTGNLTVGLDLSLIAANLDLQGKLQAGRDLTLQAQDTVKLRDTTVNPLIAAAGGNLLVQGNQKIDIFALNHSQSGLFSGGDMLLRSSNTVGGDAHYGSGGNFRIEKLDGNLGNLSSPNDPIIRASGDVSFDSYEGASLHIFAGGSVNIGSIVITGADTTDPQNSITEDVPLSISLPDATNSVSIRGASEPTLDIRAGTTAFATPRLTPDPIVGITGIVNPYASTTSADINIGSIENLNYSLEDEPVKGKILLTNQYSPNELPGKITTGLINTFGDVTIDSRGDIQTTGTVDISLGVDSGNNIRFIGNGNIIIGGDLLSDLGEAVSGNGGNITLRSKNGDIDTALINIVSDTPNGFGGDINIEASGNIYVGNITASSNSDNDTEFSNISIKSTGGSVYLDKSALDTTNMGSGYAGDIYISARDEVSILNSSTPDTDPASKPKGIFSNGNFGNIYIGFGEDSSLIPKKVTLDHSFLTTSNQVEGNNQQEIFTKDAGNIIIRTLGELSLSSSNLESATYGSGSGGYIDVKASSVSLSNKSSLLADTLGTGKAGSVTVNATDGAISLSESSINTGSDDLTLGSSHQSQEGQGGGGDINISAASLLLTKNSYLNASTFGSGNSGNFLITVDKSVSFTDNSIINARTYGTGNAGKINITTQSLSFSNQSLIQAETFGSGKAGNLDITAQLLSLTNTSRIDAQTFGSGDAGNINIKTQSLSLTDGSRLNADTRATGKGGNITINPVDEQNQAAASVNISGSALVNGFSSGLFVNTESKEPDAGSGGNITINTGTLNISDGAVLSAPSKSSGIGGNITVNVNNLEIKGGGQILTNAYRSGAAGNIKINATDNITIAGQDLAYEQRFNDLKAKFNDIKDSYDFILPENDREARSILGSINEYSGLFANTEVNSTGKGGTINIDPRQVTIKDSARISVDSQGTGVAGSISITADRLTLDNNAKITADTDSGQGGSITLDLQDLLLFRRQSLISTTAGKVGAGGDGGAIAINLDTSNGFIVSPALENNDIAANAFSGSGGTIEINAKGVIGLATLTRQELEQKLGTTDPGKLDPQGLQTNDITAISQTDPQLNGVISISSPDIDPSKGIVSLPTNATDPSQQIAQNCGAGDEKIASQFTDVGRGGLPPKPDELLSSDTVWEDIRLTANPTQPRSSSYSTTATSPQQKAVLIMPATGWVFNDKGDVTLVSYTPKSSASWLNSSSCAVKK